MGLIKRLFGRIKIPRFQVLAYGKLPCHKEYLQVGIDPLFVAFKKTLDRGFEKRISERLPRPHVLPDKRFYLIGDKQTDLVGCVFDSDDGVRAFPFMLVVSMPAKVFRKPFPVMWQALKVLWDYLEAYHQELRGQPDANAFYQKIRGVAHDIEPITPGEWPEPRQPVQPIAGPDAARHLLTVEVPRENAGVMVRNLVFDRPPAFILWPGSKWREQIDGKAAAYFGHYGLSDLRVELFRQDTEPKTVPRTLTTGNSHGTLPLPDQTPSRRQPVQHSPILKPPEPGSLTSSRPDVATSSAPVESARALPQSGFLKPPEPGGAQTPSADPKPTRRHVSKPPEQVNVQAPNAGTGLLKPPEPGLPGNRATEPPPPAGQVSTPPPPAEQPPQSPPTGQRDLLLPPEPGLNKPPRAKPAPDEYETQPMQAPPAVPRTEKPSFQQPDVISSPDGDEDLVRAILDKELAAQKEADKPKPPQPIGLSPEKKAAISPPPSSPDEDHIKAILDEELGIAPKKHKAAPLPIDKSIDTPLAGQDQKARQQQVRSDLLNRDLRPPEPQSKPAPRPPKPSSRFLTPPKPLRKPGSHEETEE
ncbi:MAG: hypothetical protein QNK37_34265 [Acidobacteriota bacterium]|nr:hypothetical protein [Acidobacteriota bacterium]